MTDFENWLSGADLKDHNDVYCLYSAVKDFDECGAFKCSQKETSKGNMYFVKCDYVDGELMLASDKARDYFLKHLEKTYVGDELDIESWYNFKYSMENDD